MKVAAISLDMAWEDKQLNFRKVESIIAQLDSSVELVILPEMFSTGFTMNLATAEDAAGETLKWMLSAAEKFNMAILRIRERTQNCHIELFCCR